jgi:hypothetical protein
MGDKQQPPLRHKPLLELATRQHGVISTRQLADLGYTRSSASKAHGVGRLMRIHRGVYAVGHTDLRWEGWCMAAVLANGPAVASHTAAAWLWDISRFRPDRFHLTVPTKRRQKREFAVHFAALQPEDLHVLNEIPVTALARTKLDLAATSRPWQLERAFERSEELQLLDLAALDGVLVRYPLHPGAGSLRGMLSIFRPDPAVTRSNLEKRFLALVRKWGFPVPATNYVVAGMELDAYWEAERFAVELDVFGTHGTHVAFERDRVRGEELLALGIEMIRITGPRLEREPQEVMRRLGEHLARRRRALA